MKQYLLVSVLSFLMALSSTLSFAQFNLDGQIIQRAEFRNGFGKLIPEGHSPARFIAHRARLQASYQMENFSFYMSIQDVRTWGNTAQVKATDPFLSLHEAWAETNLGTYWKIKLGRQELNYDNFRFLGNLDWALQGRSHDFALVKYEKEEMKLHFGGGYNQDGQALSGNIFQTANQYKSAHMVRFENKWDDLQLSVLFWNDGRQFIQRNELGEIVFTDLHYRQTLGIPTLKYPLGNTTVSAFYYYQFGKDPIGRNVSAYDFSAQVSHAISLNDESGKGFTLIGGFELLSGTDNNDPSRNRSFSPLYGTNHLFNGYMDLFYVGGTHENNVGLQDYFIKTRYNVNKKLFFQADLHGFLANAVVERPQFPDPDIQMNRYLGTETDLSIGYILHDAVSVQGGYSQLFHTDTFEFIHQNGNLKTNQNWAYLMLIFRPTMKNKFIGILL